MVSMNSAPPTKLKYSPVHFSDFCRVFGRGTGPKGSGTAVGFIWADSWVLATILDPFRAISGILGPTPYLRLEQSELLGEDRSLLLQLNRGDVVCCNRAEVLC